MDRRLRQQQEAIIQGLGDRLARSLAEKDSSDE
jgi:hypothetical protein